MPIDTFIAGAYTGTYNAVALGVTRQGFELTSQLSAELIDETDQYGNTVLDYVFRGINTFLQTTCRAYKAGPLSAAFPWAAQGQVRTAALPIGRLASDVATALVLTSTAATPAVASPATLTASKAILAENFDFRLLYDSRIRDVPIRMRLLPYESSPTTTLIQWSTT